MESWDSNTLATVKKIPLLTVKAGPRDGEAWVSRLKEEYQALIGYVQSNKANDNDWFTISNNRRGRRGRESAGTSRADPVRVRSAVRGAGDVPATFEIELPQLDGKATEMPMAERILTIHFKPLWSKNAPHFGVAHALCLGLAPWLAAEVPSLVERGVIDQFAK